MGKDGIFGGLADGMIALEIGRGGGVREMLREAARRLLEEGGSDAVEMREAARRVGVSAAAAYRCYANREDLLACVAADGFEELAAVLEAAANHDDPLIAVGLAYVDFAMTRRGLFGLMFGPTLARREIHPALDRAATAAFEALDRSLRAIELSDCDDSPQAEAARGFVRGLSSLVESAGRKTSGDRPPQRVFSAARWPKRRQADPLKRRTARMRWELN